MNESEQRKFDTKQQHESFMKSRGYTKDENGKWQRIVNVKVWKPERKERIVQVQSWKEETPPTVINFEEELRDFISEAGITKDKTITEDKTPTEEELALHEEHLRLLAHGFIELVNTDQVYDCKEIDLYYTTCKASTLLSVLTGYPPDLAYDLTEFAVDQIKEELKTNG